MNKMNVVAIISTLAATACAGSYPAPLQRMADTMSAARGAEEVGANSNPEAQLHLALAEEQISRAKALMASGENKRADYTLVRAKGDAELALALARAMNAKAEAQTAINKANSVQLQNNQTLQNATAPREGIQGAQP
jgi:hypothetical protein